MPTYDETDELIRAGEIYVRYRPFSEAVADEEVQILSDNSVWFSGVRSLDDAFEGRPRFLWEDALPTRNELMDMSYRQAFNLPVHERLVLVEDMRQRIADGESRTRMMAQIEDVTRDIYRNSSICCFSKNPKSQRFWGQYAREGSGYALLFNFRRAWRMQSYFGKPSIDMVPFEVTYRPGVERPAVKLSLANLPEDGFEEVRNALLTKSEEWKEQGEERIVRIGIPGGHVSFPGDSLCGVILGYRVEEKLAARRERLIDLSRIRAERFPIYQARLTPDGYEVELERLT